MGKWLFHRLRVPYLLQVIIGREHTSKSSLQNPFVMVSCIRGLISSILLKLFLTGQRKMKTKHVKGEPGW